MAKYLENITGFGGRSYNSLVVSEGDMPGETFLASSDEEVKFEFVYGPENNNNVVIPKGKILASAGLEYDQMTETYRPAVKICTSSDTPIGVAPYNVYENRFGAESENTVSPITRNYIKVPLFVGFGESKADVVAASIGFGAMHCGKTSTYTESTDPTVIANELMGKYVVSDDNGNFTIPSGSVSMDKVVGQVLAVEVNTPQAGFLQYCLELGNADYADYIKKTREVLGLGQNAANRRANSQFAGLASFAYGMGYPKKGTVALDYLAQLRGGIKFLTDAYFKNKVVKDFTTGATTGIKAITADTGFEIITGEGSGLTVDTVTNTINFKKEDMTKTMPSLMIKLNKAKYLLPKDIDTMPDQFGYEYDSTFPEQQTSLLGVTAPLFQLKETAEVSETNVETVGKISADRVKYDYYNNAIVVYLDPKAISRTTTAGQTELNSTKGFTQDGSFDLEIKLPVIERQIVGLPTMRDFKGCIGTAHILLQK